MTVVKSTLTPPAAINTRVEAEKQVLYVSPSARAIVVSMVTVGLTGAPGSQGIAQISADAENQLTVGTDNRLYVEPPQLASAQW